MSIHSCTCGSGLDRCSLYDARGIFCCYYCIQCEDAKRSRYRAEIFTDSQYEADDLGDDYNDELLSERQYEYDDTYDPVPSDYGTDDDGDEGIIQ